MSIKTESIAMIVALNFSPPFIHTQTVKGMKIIDNKTPIDYDQQQEKDYRIEDNNRGANNQGWQQEIYKKTEFVLNTLFYCNTCYMVSHYHKPW